MNPVFVLLVIILGIAVWFALNVFFSIIGGFFCDLYEVAKDNLDINKEEEN